MSAVRGERAGLEGAAADEHGGDALGGLAHDQPGGGRQCIPECDLGDLQAAAGAIGLAAAVEQGGDAGGPEGNVHHARGARACRSCR